MGNKERITWKKCISTVQEEEEEEKEGGRKEEEEDLPNHWVEYARKKKYRKTKHFLIEK